MDRMIATALAWAAQEPTSRPAPGESTGFLPPEILMMLLVIGVLFYILILRPQRAEQRGREKMIDELTKGDQVVTAGGIHGTVEGVDKSSGTVTVAVAPKVTLKFNRASISTVVGKKGKPKGEDGKKEEKAGQ